MKVAVTARFAVKLFILHMVSPGPEVESQPPQPTNTELPVGVAVNWIGIPLTKLWLHGPAVDGQVRPAGELVTFPVPVPGKVTVSIGPVVLRQATFAVIELLMIAPDEDRFPTL